MQLLGPPEKVTLSSAISVCIASSGHRCVIRTGCCKPREASQVSRPCRAIVRDETHKRLAPTGPCSWNGFNLWASCVVVDRMTDVQVVSCRRDEYVCPFRDGQLFVDLPGNANNRLREGQDVIFLRHTHDIDYGRVDPQCFLCIDKMGDQFSSTGLKWLWTNLPERKQVRHGVIVTHGKIAITPGPYFS